jgi:hypothetical protein
VGCSITWRAGSGASAGWPWPCRGAWPGRPAGAGPVVQVALDPAPLGVGGGDDLGPAAGQRLDPQGQLLARLGRAGPGRRPRRPRATTLATQGAASSMAAASDGRHQAERPARGRPPPAREASGQHRRRPAGRHQQAPGGPAGHGQQVVAELAPGGRGPPGPQRPQQQPRRRGPRRGRDLDPEHGPEPLPLEGAEPWMAQSSSTGPARTTPRRTRPAPSPGRPVEQAPERGQPAEDAARRARPVRRPGRQPGQGVHGRPPVARRSPSRTWPHGKRRRGRRPCGPPPPGVENPTPAAPRAPTTARPVGGQLVPARTQGGHR